MRTSEQLARQNNGEAWRDCRQAGLQHQLVLTQTVRDANYYACARGSCRVVIRKTTGRFA